MANTGIQQAFRGGYNGRPGWWISLTYSEELVARLKREVDPAYRAWNELTKQWWVAEEAAETFRAIVPAFAAYLDQPVLF